MLSNRHTDRQTHTHTHTDTQTKYCNPCCACAPRVNYTPVFSVKKAGLSKLHCIMYIILFMNMSFKLGVPVGKESNLGLVGVVV